MSVLCHSHRATVALHGMHVLLPWQSNNSFTKPPNSTEYLMRQPSTGHMFGGGVPKKRTASCRTGNDARSCNTCTWVLCPIQQARWWSKCTPFKTHAALDGVALNAINKLPFLLGTEPWRKHTSAPYSMTGRTHVSNSVRFTSTLVPTLPDEHDHEAPPNFLSSP